ncbi:MAG TPA: ABC transporter permease [Thermoanaerobacterales bacterium]|jgi:ABC-2 type transport system permease protein|nr:ABC transporter permease [Thermoanaerobacterales bacterium]
MIIFKHALKRSFNQPLSILITLILPIAIIFIPSLGNGYPNGLYLYGMLSLFSAFILSKPIVEERLSGIIIRISATPTKYISYLSSHLLAYLSILVVQNIIFILGIYIYWSDIDINYGFILSLNFAYSIMAIAFSLCWNSLFRSYNLSFGLFSGIASVMCLFSGISMPLKFIPKNIEKFIIVLPTYWLPYGLNSLHDGKINSVLIAHLVLLVYSGILLLIGSKRRY